MKQLEKRVANLEGRESDHFALPIIWRIGNESEEKALARDGRGIQPGEPVEWLRWTIKGQKA